MQEDFLPLSGKVRKDIQRQIHLIAYAIDVYDDIVRSPGQYNPPE